MIIDFSLIVSRQMQQLCIDMHVIQIKHFLQHRPWHAYALHLFGPGPCGVRLVVEHGMDKVQLLALVLLVVLRMDNVHAVSEQLMAPQGVVCREEHEEEDRVGCPRRRARRRIARRPCSHAITMNTPAEASASAPPCRTGMRRCDPMLLTRPARSQPCTSCLTMSRSALYTSL